MAGNSFGKIFKLHTFGESHGEALGGIIDGCPSGFEIDLNDIQSELDKRKPGQSKITTSRKEQDKVEFLSGIFEGKTTGTPIGFIIKNEDQKSKDYTHIKSQFRPSHADYTYQSKYGHRDYRGGGRSSARETVCRVVAGALAKQILNNKNISFHAWVHRVQDIEVQKNLSELDLNIKDQNIVRCPDSETAEKMIKRIEEIKKSGNSVGGLIKCLIQNTPAGLGEPVFNKLHADLGKSMLSINAVKSFEIGSGLSGTFMTGMEHNDQMKTEQGKVRFLSNHAGGVLGGISTGEDILMSIGFKPTATIMNDQESINDQNENVTIKGKGRHDPCVLPRAVGIVESMAALVILDHLLLSGLYR